jgi:hypothetical protein
MLNPSIQDFRKDLNLHSQRLLILEQELRERDLFLIYLRPFLSAFERQEIAWRRNCLKRSITLRIGTASKPSLRAVGTHS